MLVLLLFLISRLNNRSGLRISNSIVYLKYLGFDCCSERAISCHYITPQRYKISFEDFHYLPTYTYTQYTVHSTQYTVHSIQYTVQSTHYTGHITQDAVHSTHYTGHSSHYTVNSTQYTVHSTQDTLQSTQYIVHSTHYTHYTVHSTQFIVHIAHIAQYTLHYKMCNNVPTFFFSCDSVD